MQHTPKSTKSKSPPPQVTQQPKGKPNQKQALKGMSYAQGQQALTPPTTTTGPGKGKGKGGTTAPKGP